MGIIEFPAIFINTQTLEVDFEFHRYVRPTEHPQLTDFCIGLTGIHQDVVDVAAPLPVVLQAFDDFCQEHHLIAWNRKATSQMDWRNFCIATDGPWDVRKFLMPECDRKKIVGFSDTWKKVVNIRRLFYDHFKLERGGVKDMLNTVGLEFEGREHSGIADSYNIARLLAVLLAKGVD